MKLLSCICLLWVLSFISNAQEALPETWVVNNGVNSITRGEGKIYLSGFFDWIGPSYGSGAAVFNSTLAHDNSYPHVGKNLQAAIGDDAGGWYIADEEGITYLKADKTLEEFPLTVSGYIASIAKIGNILYIGGSFSSVNSVSRMNLAAIDLTTGDLTNWNPNANSNVLNIRAAGTVVYAGGYFSTIGGQTRSKIAALDASTGLATSWNAGVPTGQGFVSAIAVGPTTVYFGGSFSNVASGSPTRTNFAAVNSTTGALVSFNPRPDSFVYTLLLDGNTLYLAGNFSLIAGTDKPGLAAMDVTTGTFTSLDVTFNEYAEVNALAVDGQKLFIGGQFTTINGEEQPRLAVVNKTTGALEPMSAGKISDPAGALVVSGENILAISGGYYGYFEGLEGVARTNGSAAIDEETGQATDWKPEIPLPADILASPSVTLHYQDSRVYFWQDIYHVLDGYYSTVLGAVNPTDGAAIDTWQVMVEGRVEAWAFSDNALYLAGTFTEINGVVRSGFAAVDLETGALLPWTINFVPGEQEVSSMAVQNNVLYIAGEFFYSEDGERQNLAAWDATTGVLTDWAPEYFSDFGRPGIGAVEDSYIYIIGNGIYRVDETTGESDAEWLALFNEGRVNSMAIHGSSIYAGGYFSSQQVAGIVRLDKATGEVAGTQPVLEDTYAIEGSAVVAMAISETRLFAGGSFSFDLDGIQRANFAAYPLSGTVDNQPPQILATTTAVPVDGIITLDLEPLITDPDDNLDLSSLQLISQFSEQGASASLDGSLLTLDYGGVKFMGADRITIGVCDLLGECVEQELIIEVGGDIVVYNAVSPNGDEKNDLLMLQYIESFGKNKVTIFNRWGDLVFEVSDYNNADRAFTGINKNGKELPTGTYFYKIEFPGGKKSKTGYLSLKR